jgi:hypothetical protein
LRQLPIKVLEVTLNAIIESALQGTIMFSPILLTLLFSSLLAVSGCSNTQRIQDQQLDNITVEQTVTFSSDSERALAGAEARYETATEAKFNFYAPLRMAQADDALALAREAEIKGLPSDSIIASAKVIDLLVVAEQNKQKVNTILLPLLQQKQVLEQLNSSRVLPIEFKDRLEDIKSLINKIEQGADSISATEIELTMVGLKNLELNTLLEIHWQPAKNTLTKAKNENADNNAPKSFSSAETLVEQTKIYIRANYTDRALVAEKGLAALRASQHALYVARDAEQLLTLNNKSAEEAVLRLESLLAQIGATLKAKDVRHMALQDQATALAQSAETHASRLIAPLQKRISVLERQLKKSSQTIEIPKLPISSDS